MKLKHFSVDVTRHNLVVDVEFYKMNLTSIVELARTNDPDVFVDDGVFLPSWSKFAAHPTKAKGFFINMLQAIFEGKHNADELNVDIQTGRTRKDGLKVAMMFLSGSIKNDLLLEAADIAQQALAGFKVVPISGAADVTNATAEATAKEAIEAAQKAGQHVLLISAGMAQRSFSIPEITELYLAYDSGDNGATIQKMSRALTPNKAGKVGKVISLSFDPNRDDKFDALLIETAQNYQKNKNIADLKDALRDVIRTVDIFHCQPDGSVKIDVDTYLEEALARNSIDRVIGKVADLKNLSAEEIRAIASGNAEVFRAAKQEAAQRGKTKLNVAKTKKNSADSAVTVTEKELAKAREVLATIAQHSDIIRYYGGNTFEESFAIMDAEGTDIQQEVTEQFGIEYAMVKDLILNGTINKDLLELKF